VIGGSALRNEWSETPDTKTTERILKDAQEYFPSLCGAQVIDSWVGLRPLRNPIRLESCEGPSGSLLVHCYGHGGQGFVLSWGCAEAVGDIVQNKMKL
jgi:glycine/D-amino acid oxidase-like deaminating enzyme